MILGNLIMPEPDDESRREPVKTPSFNDLLASAEAAGAANAYGLGKEAGEKIGRELGAIERTAYIMELCLEAGKMPCNKLVVELKTLLLGADPLKVRQIARERLEEPEDLE